MKNFRTLYRTSSLEEIRNNKIETCIEQVWLMKSLFDKLGIILGHKKNNNKVSFSVLFGFITYIVSQISILILLFIFGLFNKDILDLFSSNSIVNNDTIKVLIVFAITGYLLITSIMNIVCVKMLNKGVNIE